MVCGRQPARTVPQMSMHVDASVNCTERSWRTAVCAIGRTRRTLEALTTFGAQVHWSRCRNWVVPTDSGQNVLRHERTGMTSSVGLTHSVRANMRVDGLAASQRRAYSTSWSRSPPSATKATWESALVSLGARKRPHSNDDATGWRRHAPEIGMTTAQSELSKCHP